MSRAADLARLDNVMSTQWAFRNRFINGGFDNWQRGSNFTLGSANIYTADRWLANAGTSGAGTVAKGTQWNGGDAGAYGDNYFSLAQTTLASSVGSFSQKIEGVKTLAGKFVVISGVLANYSTTLTTTLKALALQNFGTSGSAQVSTAIGSVVMAPGALVPINMVAFIPAVSGKVVGANNNLEIVFQTPADTQLFNFAVINLQIEEGLVATPFEVRPYGMELSLCQRYCERITSSSLNLGYGIGYMFNASSGYVTLPIQTPKRASPSLTTSAMSTFLLTSPATGNVAPTSITPMAIGASNLFGMQVITASTAGTVGSGCGLEGAVGAASFIMLDSEIYG